MLLGTSPLGLVEKLLISSTGSATDGATNKTSSGLHNANYNINFSMNTKIRKMLIVQQHFRIPLLIPYDIIYHRGTGSQPSYPTH